MMNFQVFKKMILPVLFGAVVLLFAPHTIQAEEGHGHKGEMGHHPDGDVTGKVVNAIVEMHHHLGDGHIEWAHMKAEFHKIEHEVKEIGEHASVELVASIEEALEHDEKDSFSHNLLSVCYYMMVDKLHQTEDQIGNFRSAKEQFQNAALAYKPISRVLSRSDPKLDKDIKMAFRMAAKALGSPKKPGSANKTKFNQEKERIEAYLHSYSLEKAGNHGH